MKSQVWGFHDYPVSQDFGIYNASLAGWYQYASDYGWPAGTHIGLDVGMPRGTPIYANEPGVVERAGFSDSFRPKPVWIRENDGDTAIYGHMWTNTVKVGDRVKKGDVLGTSGEQTVAGTMTPDGSGPHIHFELRSPSGKAIDPTPELQGSGKPYDNETMVNDSRYSFGVDSGQIQAYGKRMFVVIGGALAVVIGVMTIVR